MASSDRRLYIKDQLKGLTWDDLKSENPWLKLIKEIAPSAEDQVDLILFTIRAGQDFYNSSNKVLSRLKSIVSMHFGFYANVNVILFGSASNDLALKDSDVDIFIEFADQKFDAKTRLSEIERLLKTFPNDFQEVKAIDCLVPIIQCKSSGLSLDISFVNALGMYNSNLIKLLANSSDKIKNLIIILKFWFRTYVEKKYKPCLTIGLFGSFTLHANKLRSCALTMMVLFYLQQKNYVPPVFNFLDTYGKKVQGWAVSVKGLSLSASFCYGNISIFDLLEGFFGYYANFDFESQVICPFIGRSLSKHVISKPNLLPSEYTLYKENFRKNPKNVFECNGELCIQDPFIHNRNITRKSDKQLTSAIRKACNDGYNICKINDRSDFFSQLFNS